MTDITIKNEDGEEESHEFIDGDGQWRRGIRSIIREEIEAALNERDVQKHNPPDSAAEQQPTVEHRI